MPGLETFPAQEDLDNYEKVAQPYMHPNRIPAAVILEGYFSDEDCDRFTVACSSFQAYEFPHCGATTKEIGYIPALAKIEELGHRVNKAFWDYDLDDETVTWMQTYHYDGDYALHSDGQPGQMRKLTAVTMLTDPEDYRGGVLTLYYHPAFYEVPMARGTVCIFQPWILHEVSRVKAGTRRTLNTAFWGPNFR